MYQWNSSNLNKHYLKHPFGQCKECWTLALNTPHKPISIDEYEEQSKAVIDRKWLFFTARFLEKATDNPEVHQYYVDEKLLVTVCRSNDIKTSYKFHSGEGEHDNEINLIKKINLFIRYKNRESYSEKKMFDFNVRYFSTKNLNYPDKITLQRYKEAFVKITRS